VQSLGRSQWQGAPRGSWDDSPARGIGREPTRFARAARLRFGNSGWRSLVVISLTAAVGYGLWTSGKSEVLYREAMGGLEKLAVASGFGVQRILVEGQNRLADEELAKALGAGTGSLILGFNTDAAKARLETVPWVKRAQIMRLLPSTLRVVIEERTPYAMWQSKGKTYVVDAEGTVLAPAARDAYANLPLVVGDGAGKAAAELMRLLQPFETIGRELVAAIRVGDRRWTLKLASGIEVMLPDNGIEDALKTLVSFEKERGLLQRDIAAVDLRLGDRIGVRLREQTAPVTTPEAQTDTDIPTASTSGKT
jgi:cell division protein FtsQ